MSDISLFFFIVILLISATYCVFFVSYLYTDHVFYVIILLTEKHKDEVKQIKFKDKKEALMYFQNGEM